jgi:hypothetical protein
MLGAPLEVPVFKQRDVASYIFSDQCRVRLDESQLRGELATKVHFLRSEDTLISSSSLVQRVWIGARVDFHENTAPLQHKT